MFGNGLDLCCRASWRSVVEMRKLGRVRVNGATTVHPQAQTAAFVDLLIVTNSRFATLRLLAGRINWMRSTTEKPRIFSRKTETPCCRRGS
jgi:hypothetical protein